MLLTAKTDVQEKELADTKEALTKWKAAYRSAQLTQAKKSESERARLAGENVLLQQESGGSRTKEPRTVSAWKRDSDALRKVRSGGSAGRARAIHRHSRVKLENLVQDYQDKIGRSNGLKQMSRSSADLRVVASIVGPGGVVNLIALVCFLPPSASPRPFAPATFCAVGRPANQAHGNVRGNRDSGGGSSRRAKRQRHPRANDSGTERGASDAGSGAAQPLRIGANNLGADPNHPGLHLPNVPNGLTTNGLQVAPDVRHDPNLWQGANLPTQTVNGDQTNVTIVQTAQQALLNWQTFNVGRDTQSFFDQTAGGANVTPMDRLQYRERSIGRAVANSWIDRRARPGLSDQRQRDYFWRLIADQCP